MPVPTNRQLFALAAITIALFGELIRELHNDTIAAGRNNAFADIISYRPNPCPELPRRPSNRRRSEVLVAYPPDGRVRQNVPHYPAR